VAVDTYLSEGSVSGSLLTVASGQDGFGYDPIFVPTEAELHAAGLPLTLLGQSFAMLSLAQKNQLSHRTRAVRAMLPNLIALVAQQNA
jgi:XTP/dITP diphosphohydrolase